MEIIEINRNNRQGASVKTKTNSSGCRYCIKKRIFYKKFLLISFYIFLFLPVSIFSQSDSLLSYLEIAAKKNPAVLQRFTDYRVALEKIPQVGSLPDPELTLGVFVRPMELVMGTQVADLKLMQMFPWFGTLKYAKDEMSLMAKAKYESFLDAKSQLYYDVSSSWYNLYRLNQDLRISQRNLLILNTIERLTLILYRTSAGVGTTSPSVPGITTQNIQAGAAGMQGMPAGQQATVTPGTTTASSMQGAGMGNTGAGTGLTDLYRIRIESGNLENEIALIRDRIRTATAKFNTLLDRSPRAAVAVADTLEADSLDISVTGLADSILKNNPMLKMLDLERQSFEARKKMVTRMGYPMVGIGIDYSLINKSAMVTSAGNGMDMIMPMVSATLPVYRKKYKAMQNEAELQKTSSELNYRAMANNLLNEFYQALESYEDAMRRVKLYAGQSLLAEKSLDIVIRSFSTAGNNLTDVLLLRQQTLDYELKRSEAVADINTSVAWLNKLSGNEIKEINGNKWK